MGHASQEVEVVEEDQLVPWYGVGWLAVEEVEGKVAVEVAA